MATKKKTLKRPTKATAKAPTANPTTASPTIASPTAPAGGPQPDPNALSIGDLKNLSSILDVASTRGAFKAAEMAGVGFLYNKLQAFLAKVAPPEQKPEDAKAGQPTTVAPTTVAPTTVAPATAGGGK
jgi:hypothetical protein